MDTHLLSGKQYNALILLRILVGWHFLYEGITKLYNPSWTSKAYLLNAKGPLSELFIWLSGDGLIGIVDYMNIFGLVTIGLTLILGFWEKIATATGIMMLLFYYLSQPPFPGVVQLTTEGNYFLVNKNLIEAAGLLVLHFLPTGKIFGIQRLFPIKPETQLN